MTDNVLAEIIVVDEDVTVWSEEYEIPLTREERQAFLEWLTEGDALAEALASYTYDTIDSLYYAFLEVRKRARSGE